MSEATCAVLAAVFPLYMVTAILERRATNMGIRRRKFYRWISFLSVSFAAIGTVYAVIGVGAGGFSVGHAFVLWLLFYVSSLGVVLAVVGSLATAELEEEWFRPARSQIRPSAAGRSRRSGRRRGVRTGMKGRPGVS